MTSEEGAPDAGEDAQAAGDGGGQAGSAPMVDFHSHVIPGVDDGARDVEQGIAALYALWEQGVRTVLATPHLDASLTERPELLAGRLAAFDRRFADLEAALLESGLELRLDRGTELKLDTPEPDFSDGRVRLAGTRFVLVEFSAFRLPPYGGRQLSVIRGEGWLPVLAHPERYLGVEQATDRVASWREGGAYFQVNSGSLVGQYGAEAQRAARRMLSLGWVDFLSSDYHSRGTPYVAAARDLLLEAVLAPDSEYQEWAAGEESLPGDPVERAVTLLTRVNAERMLKGEKPIPVPPLALEKKRWRSLRELLG